MEVVLLGSVVLCSTMRFSVSTGPEIYVYDEVALVELGVPS